uniref:F420H(2):quinone oxidoreductase n=1 Tax=Geoglobus ahangari TaxID=113653 RepID=A0A7C4WCP8_9EURY
MIEIGVSIILLSIGYLIASSAQDVVRLLISLELMFSAVFLSLLPLFSNPQMAAEGSAIAILTIFTSSGELLILVAAIIFLDRKFRSVSIKKVSSGGDAL